jgi:tetratricopeptide (TPR) repeat protein
LFRVPAAASGGDVTARSQRFLGIASLFLGLALGGVAVTIFLTWPDNVWGVYLHERRNHQANVRALEWRVGAETDSTLRAFYQAWLAEEKGDLGEAIRGFQSLRDDALPGSPFHLRTSVRLGLAYGLNHEPERELATYQALIDRYPGPSRLSQATFYLRQGEKDRARETLDEALARDEEDGSLGTDRPFAQFLRARLAPARGGESSIPR